MNLRTQLDFFHDPAPDVPALVAGGALFVINHSGGKAVFYSYLYDMKSGIYKIGNQVTGDFYIGSSSNTHKRKLEHFRALGGNYHANSRLQRAFNKYGKEAFVFEVVERCADGRLLAIEQRYLDELKPAYNLATIAGGRFRAGVPLSDKNKALLSALKTGRALTEKAKQLLRDHNLGKTHSAETREKLGALSKKAWADPAYRENLSKQRQQLWNDEAKKADMIEKVRAKAKSPERVEKLRAQCQARFEAAPTLYEVTNVETGEALTYKGMKAAVAGLGSSDVTILKYIRLHKIFRSNLLIKRLRPFTP